MRFGLRLAFSCAVLVVALVAVGGGSAGPRTPDNILPTFDAFPGPGQVTYGQQIAYKATLENKSGTTLTHVIFRQVYPAANGASAVPVEGLNTCPTVPVTITNSDGDLVWTCDFGNVSDGGKVGLTVVWQVPPQGTATANCDGCLVSNGRWTVKEGVNDVSDPNDSFPAGGKDVYATLLASNTGGDEKLKAGGYETQGSSCADPEGAGSLQTSPGVDPTKNPVSTTVCLPSFYRPANGVDLGYVTQITELDKNAQYSDVCVADLGWTCEPGYHEADFQTLVPPGVITLVFHVADGALPKGYKITWVSHNGGEQVAVGACDEYDFCVTSIDLKNVKGTKIWTIVVTTPTNGYFDW